MTSSAPDADLDDDDLLARHVAGSQTAFAELVRRHQNRLWAVALRMMRDPEDAADVVQDALVKAFRHAEGFRGDAAVTTWLHRIVVTTALDALRAAARTRASPLVDLDPADPHDQLSTSETRMDVLAALAALPIDQRVAIVLVDLGGFSVEQAAWSLQCPAGTVKSRCSRGRDRLAQMLSACGPAEAARNRRGPPDVQDDEPESTHERATRHGREESS